MNLHDNENAMIEDSPEVILAKAVDVIPDTIVEDVPEKKSRGRKPKNKQYFKTKFSKN